MAKRTKPRHLDRITHVLTGEVGTIIEVHTETKPKGSPPNYTVLLDTGPRASVLWQGAEVEVDLIERTPNCHRCGEKGHTVVTCTRGDMP